MIGRTLGHYRIEEELGKGGMGEVYRAYDEKLKRDVALKFLPAGTAKDSTALERLLREAQSAAGLNHPNICTVYEIGEQDGHRFIAMELLEGWSLKDRIASGPFEWDELFELGVQIADALAAAHRKDIVHRDMKPGNVFITKIGQAKILDFGLAKAARPADGATTLDMLKETEEAQLTSPGAVVGTVAYMSPEQALAKAVDARSDIFSLGVVLYEIATGRRPFQGTSQAALHDAILNRTPESVSAVNPDAPAGLDAVLNRCLEKDRDLRYQSAADLRAELKRLKRDTSSGKLSGTRTGTAVTSDRADLSSDSQVISDLIKRHPTGVYVTAGVLTAVLAAASFGIYVIVTGKRVIDPKITRVTFESNIDTAVISLDGKTILYSKWNDDKESLWLHHIESGSVVQIAAEMDFHYLSFAYSPDGNFVYYNGVASAQPEHARLYRIPALGGTPQSIANNVGQGISVSSDGTRVAFVRSVHRNSQIVLASTDGSGEAVLAERTVPEFFYGRLAWSADDKRIITAVGNLTDNPRFSLVEIPTGGGEARQFSDFRWKGLGDVLWLPNGNGLVIRGVAPKGSSGQLWLVSADGSSVRRITNDFARYSGISLNSDGTKLLSIYTNNLQELWTLPAGEGAVARKLSRSGHSKDGRAGLDWVADGRVVYTSIAAGSVDLWIRDALGGDSRRLTLDDDSEETFPSVSPDGRSVAYVSNSADSLHLWRVPTDGGTAEQITFGTIESAPLYSPDGKNIFYFRGREGVGYISRSATDGEEITDVIANVYYYIISLSPDGSQLLLYERDPETPRRRLAIYSANTGKLLQTIPSLSTSIRYVDWSPDGQAIVYAGARDSFQNLWRYPLDGGEQTKITDFEGLSIWKFSFAPDGALAVSRGSLDNDIVLIENFH